MINCFEYGKPGHKATECWHQGQNGQRNNNNRGENFKNDNQGNVHGNQNGGHRHGNDGNAGENLNNNATRPYGN